MDFHSFFSSKFKKSNCTSRNLVQTRVSKGRDVPLSLCPGSKIFPCPVVPLSRDKLLCPGTSRNKISFPKKTKNFQFWTFMPFSGKKIVIVPSRILKDCPGLSHGKILSLSLCPGTMKKLLSLCPARQDRPAPLETLVGSIDVKGIHFAQPIWSSGCPM